MPISLKKNPSNKGRLEKKDRNPPTPPGVVVLEGTFLGPVIIKKKNIKFVNCNLLSEQKKYTLDMGQAVALLLSTSKDLAIGTYFFDK